MSWQFSFSIRLEITEDQFGLRLPITLSVAGREAELRAYFDIGAAYCVLPRYVGEQLRLDVEAGESVSLRTATGAVPGYLHYADLTLGDLVFEDVPVFVVRYSGFDRCLLGRAGWLQKARVNLVTYDKHFYLDLHGQ